MRTTHPITMGEDQVQRLADLMAEAIGRLNVQGAAALCRHVRNIQCDNYTVGKDFSMWLSHFQDNVRVAYGLPRNHDDLPGLYVDWISTKMEPGPTRTIYNNLEEDVMVDWALLEPALTAVFRDDSERIPFLSNMDAYLRAEGQTLRKYRDELVRRMDKYQHTLRNVPEEWN